MDKIKTSFLAYIRAFDTWSISDSVLLRDVQVLTLYQGRYTNSRRTSPVPHLQCVGGTAGCGSFVPDVVQCQNKGWDGVDVQWECKTDMDETYRFGRIEVSCEGYSHPDDPHILKGSCGLEYTLELTAQGRQRGGGGGGGGFASSFFQGSSDGGRGHQAGNAHPQSSTAGDASGLVVVALFLLLAYGVYKMFLCGPLQGQERFPGSDPQGPGPQGHHGDAHPTGPAPPGFKPDYTDAYSGSGAGYPGAGSAGYPGASSDYGFRSQSAGPQPTRNSASTGGGFWTGMGTGGLLGYLFGSQRRQPGMFTGGFNPGHSWNAGNSGHSWNAGNSGHSWNAGTPKTPPSSGTRTASGFGGTKRR
ncbi:hypothetical protein AAFF_G00265840 [Aldrovandia affinis]|uniref:Store-operated calcium entry-associated regulatory factor n=1 Tax=Aldrovandia affinis TaxID=143900 RepID=A0AAD7W2M0_9TELE|nr:hypothetical protein AAFF_G00265840 [Aldrovandia affinis]